MPDPVLYGQRYSVYTRIARLALEEKEVRYTLEEVEIFGPGGVPADHLDRHPFGRIPVLSHGAFQLYETGAITRYVDEAFEGRALQPKTATQRARMNQIMSILDVYAYRPMIWGVFVQRISVPQKGGVPDEQVIAEALPMVQRCLQVLEYWIGAHRFLVADELTLADIHAAPMLIYFAATPEGQRMLPSFTGVRRWLEQMKVRSSITKTEWQYG